MEILYALEKIRVPVLNEFMLQITQFGEETAFLVVALILFWCVDKHRGYYVLSAGLLGTVANQFLKLIFRVPRPWVLDPEFTILEQAREAASGYSFPSGHTQNAVGVFGATARGLKNKWVKVGCISVAVLVPLSRMYIGVHTPADVLASVGIAVLLIVALHPLTMGNAEKFFPLVLAVMLVLSIGFLLFVECLPFPVDIDAHNLESGVKNAYTMAGCIVGLIVVYAVDKRWLKFSEKAVWWAQILKVLGGLVIVLLIKEGLRAPLETLCAGHMAARAIRYCLIVLAAGIAWPLTFGFFSRLGKGKEARM